MVREMHLQNCTEKNTFSPYTYKYISVVQIASEEASCWLASSRGTAVWYKTCLINTASTLMCNCIIYFIITANAYIKPTADN